MNPKPHRKKRVSDEKPGVTLPGTVEKIIPAVARVEPEKAQIAVEGADHLYREIRIENVLVTEEGEDRKLTPGAQVEVTIEAEPEATKPVHGVADDKGNRPRNHDS